jgi:hypothetical protein
MVDTQGEVRDNDERGGSGTLPLSESVLAGMMLASGVDPGAPMLGKGW